MAAKPKEGLSLLEKMPIDVLSCILTFIQDREALRSVIRSCRALHDAFKQREAYIASSVLFRTMDEGVYQECVVAFNLKLQKWQGADAGIEAIDRVFMGDRSINRENLTLSQVQEMWRVQRSVEYFTNRIAVCLKDANLFQGSKSRITSKALSRFQRAMYRLDMQITVSKAAEEFRSYPQGVRSWPPIPYEMQDPPSKQSHSRIEELRLMKAFHSHFSAVEVEQMICVCEFLIMAIGPIFNHFLEEDIDLGSQVPCYIDNQWSLIGMTLIREGLPFLFSFATAPRHEIQSEVMREAKTIVWTAAAVEHADTPGPDQQLSCDLDDLEAAARPWGLEDLPFPETTLRTPFYDDGNTGPEDAWKQYGKVAEARGSVGFDSHMISRSTGYVFWDCPCSNNSELVELGKVAFRCDRLPESLEQINGRDPIQWFWNSLHKWDDVATELLEAAHEEKIKLKSEGKTGFFHFGLFGYENTADADIDSDFLDDDDYIDYD
ncbi:hypothetical protein ACJ41O_010713 [Fusarium nematophilum]